MWKDAMRGAIAGAAGTVALDITTYIDMAVRARPSSEVPAKVAARLFEKADLNLGSSNGEPTDDAARNRFQGLGAVMGNAVGLKIGAGYGLIAHLVDDIPLPIAGLLVGAAAMAATDVTAAKLEVTKPGEWDAASWISDIVPHAIYGLITVATYRALARGR